MFTIRTHHDGQLLAEHDFTPDPKWGTLNEFLEVAEFTKNHYPDPSGITVDVHNESGTIVASVTFP